MGTAVGAEQTASRPDENRELTVRRGASAWILIQRNLRRLGLVLGLLGAGVVFLNIRNAGGPGLDLSAYLNASKANAYRVDVGSRDAFVYAPPFLQAMYPIQHVPVDVARMVWLVLNLTALIILAGPWTLVALLAMPVVVELAVGNIHLLLALAMVVGFRYPQTWAFVLLTKPTAGVGLLWFAVRREWRSLALVLSTTTAIAAVSFLVAPALWFAWAQLLVGNASHIPGDALLRVPLPVRLAVAAVVVVVGARRNHKWVVPVAGLIALPVIWVGSLALLVATIPLLRRGTSP